jgi:hypothetical protein
MDQLTKWVEFAGVMVAYILSLGYLGIGGAKLGRTREQLVELSPTQMGWVMDFSPGVVKAIGGLELAIAIGLGLPLVAGHLKIVVPVAASALALVQVGALAVHLRRGERSTLGATLTILGMALFVAFVGYLVY